MVRMYSDQRSINPISKWNGSNGALVYKNSMSNKGLVRSELHSMIPPPFLRGGGIQNLKNGHKGGDEKFPVLRGGMAKRGGIS